ncbi:Protein of unknown function [Gryllus bimaculatus]|nr:Protein of unknown function [Gryllus bimaculatus]
MSLRFSINCENDSSGNEADCESDFDHECMSSQRVPSRRCSIGKAINKFRSVAKEENGFNADSCTSGANVSGKKTVHKMVATLIESARSTKLPSTSEEEAMSKMGARLFTASVACKKLSVSNDNYSDSSCYSSCYECTNESSVTAHSETEIDSESEGQLTPEAFYSLEALNSEFVVKLQSITPENETSAASLMDMDGEMAEFMC